MPDAKAIQFTPVQARRGRRVHALTLTAPKKTACGEDFTDGWRISLKRLNCRRCKLAIVHDCRPRRRKRVS